MLVLFPIPVTLFATHVLKCFKGPVKCMQMSNNLIMSGSEDATIKMLDLNSGKIVNRFHGHVWGVACLQFDSTHLVLYPSFACSEE